MIYYGRVLFTNSYDAIVVIFFMIWVKFSSASYKKNDFCQMTDGNTFDRKIFASFLWVN